jgi:hypothetical protein
LNLLIDVQICEMRLGTLFSMAGMRKYGGDMRSREVNVTVYYLKYFFEPTVFSVKYDRSRGFF